MRLRRPLPLTSALLAPVQAGYTLAETGAFVILAAAWWPKGELPETDAAAARLLRTKHDIARRVLAEFRAQFEPGGRLRLLREAHIVKARRRANAGKAALAARAARVQGAGPDRGGTGERA